jgi:protein-glucosylgalactosylhydroxylysine glucosidase
MVTQWGWHSFPNPEGYRMEDVLTDYESHGRKVLRAAP